MTLEQLRVFLAVAERLHMTRAAAALNMTQSAASASVAALEARHGVRLFDRVGRGLALTEAGRTLLPEARAVLARAGQAVQALDDLAGLRRGALTVGASQTVASYWLPPHLARFGEAHPGVKLTMIAGNTAQVAQAVLDGVAEIGFVEGEVANPLLARRRLAGDRLGLYAAARHALSGTAIDAAALRTLAWVMRDEGSGTRAALEVALVRIGVDPDALHVVLDLPSNEAALAAVAAGGAVTAVSELAARPMLAEGRIVRLDLDLGERRFDLIARVDRRRSRAAEALLALIVGF
jgi:DNA-binding transcriptional LysR family regulator